MTAGMTGTTAALALVSALVGALQYGSGIAGSGLVGAFADGTPWPMGWVIALSGIGCVLATRLLSHDSRNNGRTVVTADAAK